MAALVWGTNAIVVYGEGTSEYLALIALRKVSAGDTLDLTTYFSNALAATMVGTAGPAAGASATATITANSVTIPAGPSSSAGAMLVFGVHA
jgi:hypothetical protein